MKTIEKEANNGHQATFIQVIVGGSSPAFDFIGEPPTLRPPLPLARCYFWELKSWVLFFRKRTESGGGGLYLSPCQPVLALVLSWSWPVGGGLHAHVDLICINGGRVIGVPRSAKRDGVVLFWKYAPGGWKLWHRSCVTTTPTALDTPWKLHWMFAIFAPGPFSSHLVPAGGGLMNQGPGHRFLLQKKPCGLIK